jgi:hypothetical protein
MFRWGIMSTAKIGRDQVIPQLQDSENGVVTAIASRDHSRARALADRFGAPYAFSSYQDLLTSPEVDGVYIPLPTSQHIEWSIKAARAGKHVLCEKPIALNAARDRAPDRGPTPMACWSARPSWSPTIRNGARFAISLPMARSAVCAMCRARSPISTPIPKTCAIQPDLGGGGLPDIGVYPTVSTRFSTGCEPGEGPGNRRARPGIRHRPLRQRQG